MVRLSYPQSAVWLGSSDAFSQYGACLRSLIAYIGSDWHGTEVPTWGFSYSDLPLGPFADIGFKQPLHAPHRLLYRWIWKINEGGEVNKGGFRRSSFTLLQLFNNPVTDCWGMNQPQSVLQWIDFGDLPCVSQRFFLLLGHCG